MKTNINNQDPQLSRVLHGWRLDASLPPRFQENVWKRIEAAECKPDRAYETNWLMTWLRRPAFATACAALLLLGGLTTGLLRAQHDAAHANAELAQRYVASVNPYAHPGH